MSYTNFVTHADSSLPVIQIDRLGQCVYNMLCVCGKKKIFYVIQFIWKLLENIFFFRWVVQQGAAVLCALQAYRTQPSRTWIMVEVKMRSTVACVFVFFGKWNVLVHFICVAKMCQCNLFARDWVLSHFFLFCLVKQCKNKMCSVCDFIYYNEREVFWKKKCI